MKPWKIIRIDYSWSVAEGAIADLERSGRIFRVSFNSRSWQRSVLEFNRRAGWQEVIYQEQKILGI